MTHARPNDAPDVPAQRYDAALTRLQAVEGEVAQAVARALAAERLTEATRQELAATALTTAAEKARLDEELDRLRRELARRTEELARCTTALGSVVDSSSWRVTRPLRRLTGSTRPERA